MTEIRRVRRIIRKIDSWTVFKVAALFWLVAGLALVLGLVMFWSVFDASGIPDRITTTLKSISLIEETTDPFGNTEQFMRVAIFGSLVFSVLATGMTTLAGVMYNLIADVVGGFEIVVLEETLVAPVIPRTYLPPPPTEVTAGVDVPTEETPVTARR